ncbi:MAG: ornithine cyclodeaminase family protein [Actinobacteria bacterium]|nr:ornithine cyclodeaminase family protein [Actinomycetota bacterium]
MGDLFVLTETVIRELVGFGEAELAAVEAVYPLISDGSAVMPDIMRIDVEAHNGEIDVKSAFLPGYPGIAIKVSAGFFDNPKRGLPSLGGFMVVLDAETGIPAAALFDNGYLTDLRTGLAGAVAARHLARSDSSHVAVLGAGVQARFQVQALRLVLAMEMVTVWGRRREQAEVFARDLSEQLGIEVRAADSVAAAVAEADVVVSTTPATDGFLKQNHLRAGQHLTTVGSDAEHKRELGEGIFDLADVVVVDSLRQSMRLGEARSAVAEGYDPEGLIELGTVVAAKHAGRTNPEQITLCDLTGTGAQDTAIAGLTVQRAREQSRGDVVIT